MVSAHGLLQPDTWKAAIDARKDEADNEEIKKEKMPYVPPREVSAQWPAAFSDVVELRDQPYYLTYGLSAWVSADHIAGPESSAEQTRLPSLLAMEKLPHFSCEPSLEVKLVPSLLRTHLTDRERANAEADRLTLAHFLGGVPGPGDAAGLPLLLLVDLWLEYTIYLNVGSKESKKLMPIAELRVPRDKLGKADLLNNHPTLGFEVVLRTDVLTNASVERLPDAQFKVTLGPIEAPIFAALRGEAGTKESNYLFMSIRRGSLASAPAAIRKI